MAQPPSPLSMMDKGTDRAFAPRTYRLDRAALWIVLAIGALLMFLAAVSRGEETATASRTDRFTATLPKGGAVRIENISGDVVASPGKQFSAVVTTTVWARSQSRANEILGRTAIVQSREGDDYWLETRWPGMPAIAGEERSRHSSRTGRTLKVGRCSDCKIIAKYELVVPPGVTAALRTVNGEVRVRDLDGKLDLGSVNGDVVASGARAGVAAQSVNGKVDVAARAVPAGSAFQLNTVNGGVTLTLPKDSHFALSASTMNGVIASTFPLPARDDAAEEDETTVRAPRTPRPPRPPRAVVRREAGEDVEIDLKELEKELDEAMKQVDVDVRESVREAQRHVRRVKILDPRREYTASLGQGGASVRLSTLNGPVYLLAEGTREGDAKPLVSKRRSFAVTIPRIQVDVRRPVVAAPPAPPRSHVQVDASDDEVVRGDVAGDFLSTTEGAGYRIGKVSGRVKILTHSGEIHVAAAGAGADVKTFGGDIRIGSVNGDLSAQTMAGDIRCRTVSGSFAAETSGGDVRVDRIDGGAKVRTGGGDIFLPAVGGAVVADTGGGEVRIAVLSREPKGGISIHNAGGDVTLTLPADFRGDVDLTIGGSPGEDEMIRSDFPEIAITRRTGLLRGSGSLNGGGVKVSVQTSSGAIRLRKSPPLGR